MEQAEEAMDRDKCRKLVHSLERHLQGASRALVNRLEELGVRVLARNPEDEDVKRDTEEINFLFDTLL